MSACPSVCVTGPSPDYNIWRVIWSYIPMVSVISHICLSVRPSVWPYIHQNTTPDVSYGETYKWSVLSVMSVCLSVRPSVCLSVRLCDYITSHVCVCDRTFTRLQHLTCHMVSISSHVCLSVRLCVCLSVRPSLRPYITRHVCLSIRPTVHSPDFNIWCVIWSNILIESVTLYFLL